jgi:hypothetical protein
MGRGTDFGAIRMIYQSSAVGLRENVTIIHEEIIRYVLINVETRSSGKN